MDVVYYISTSYFAVFDKEAFCLESEDNSITCPQDHKIIIREALYKVTKTGPCPNDTMDACTLSNVTKTVSKECQNKNPCTVSVPDSGTECTSYSGKKFVTVRYKCEPGRQSLSQSGTSVNQVGKVFRSINCTWLEATPTSAVTILGNINCL